MSPEEIDQRRRIARLNARRKQIPVGHDAERDAVDRSIKAAEARLEAILRYEWRMPGATV